MTKTEIMALQSNEIITIRAGVIQDLLVKLDSVKGDCTNLGIVNDLLRKYCQDKVPKSSVDSIDLDN
jgi:hypothetical protein